VDEAQMKQVYVNLALNAFEAMEHRGTLAIVVESSPGDEVGLLDTRCVRLRFRDTGPGVAPGEETAIFEPFHTTKPHGTGLGLSIASRIVESHGGRIDVATLPEGGAEFSVYLPDGASGDSLPIDADETENEEAQALAGPRGSA
jgi:signal transduction histidine kinase